MAVVAGGQAGADRRRAARRAATASARCAARCTPGARTRSACTWRRAACRWSATASTAARRRSACERQALHAARLAFAHPLLGRGRWPSTRRRRPTWRRPGAASTRLRRPEPPRPARHRCTIAAIRFRCDRPGAAGDACRAPERSTRPIETPTAPECASRPTGRRHRAPDPPRSRRDRHAAPATRPRTITTT